MDLVKLPAVVLLFVCFPAAVRLVEPPDNVTLQCHNMQNILKWSYGELLPELRFRVDVHPYEGSASVIWVDPPAQQADISNFSDPNNDHLLLVTAVIGQNESEPSPPDGIPFSYFMNSPIAQTCSLDLPPVNISAQSDETVIFRFTHPWLWYQPMMLSSSNQKRRKKKSYDAQHKQQLPTFKYGVVVVSQKHPHHFSCMKSVCEQKIPVEGVLEKKHCLNISGEMEKMTVKSTQLYCAMPLEEVPPNQNNSILFIVVGVLVASVVAFVLFLVYKKMTSPATELPAAMKINKTTRETTATVKREITEEIMEPTSPTPLLSHREEENDFTLVGVTATESSGQHMPIRSRNHDDLCDDMEGGLPDDEEGMYTKGRNMDEGETNDGEVLSAYEKRPLVVEMGPDELAEGYREC